MTLNDYLSIYCLSSWEGQGTIYYCSDLQILQKKETTITIAERNETSLEFRGLEVINHVLAQLLNHEMSVFRIPATVSRTRINSCHKRKRQTLELMFSIILFIYNKNKDLCGTPTFISFNFELRPGNVTRCLLLKKLISNPCLKIARDTRCLQCTNEACMSYAVKNQGYIYI